MPNENEAISGSIAANAIKEAVQNTLISKFRWKTVDAPDRRGQVLQQASRCQTTKDVWLEWNDVPTVAADAPDKEKF